MGVTLHYTMMQERGYIKGTLDHAEKVARDIKENQADKAGIEMEVTRDSDTQLRVDIAGCETLMFLFKRHGQVWADWRGSYGEVWLPFNQTVDNSDHIRRWPDQETYWCSEFCKTQFGDGVACHIWASEVIRAVAGMCKIAKVNDEGDYYHNRDRKMAQDAIAQVGGMINSMMGTFQSMGYEVEKGGETKIKKSKQ